DYHATTRGDGWTMRVETADAGLRVTAFDGARPVTIAAPGAGVVAAPVWYHRFDLALERERGLDSADDHLRAGTFRATLRVGDALTAVCSSEPAPGRAAEAAWGRRVAHEDAVVRAWRTARPTGDEPPEWVAHLALAADQFVVARPLRGEPDGRSII